MGVTRARYMHVYVCTLSLLGGQLSKTKPVNWHSVYNDQGSRGLGRSKWQQQDHHLIKVIRKSVALVFLLIILPST
jgi:hypothetical protein